MRSVVLLSIAAFVAIAAANETEMFSVEDTGADLVEMPAFAVIANKAHLAYLHAKAFAVKNSKASVLVQATASCHAARAAHFQMCANEFAKRKSAEEASKLDLAMLLESPTFALVEAESKLHASCKVHAEAAFAQCRDAFLQTKKPSHEMLMQTTDVAEFVKLADTFSKDGHSHVFETAFMQAKPTVKKLAASAATPAAKPVAAPASATTPAAKPATKPAAKPATKPAAPVAVVGKPAPQKAAPKKAAPSGPGPTKQTLDEKQDKTMTEHFRDMEHAQEKVKEDEQNIPQEPIPHPDKPVEKSELELAVDKCGSLREDTFKHCGKLMCDYHKKCGTADNVAQCKSTERLNKIDERHKEASFKLGRRMKYMKEQKAKELKVKAPELKTKAAEKAVKWKASAPERAAKKVEAKEIDEKAKKMVDGWVPGGYKLEKSNPFKVTSQRKGDRRLLATEGSASTPLPAKPPAVVKPSAKVPPKPVGKPAAKPPAVVDGQAVNADAIIAKLAAEKKAAVAAAAAVKAKLNSPMCKAMASNAFDECEVLTEHAYDMCTSVLNAADEHFLKEIAEAEALEKAKKAGKTITTKAVEKQGATMPSGVTPTVAKKKAAAYASAAVAVKAVAQKVPAPVGQTKPVPQVATAVAKVHQNSVSTATDMAKSQAAVATGNYPAATKEAHQAAEIAASNVAQAKEVAQADLNAASAEAGSPSELEDDELYQQQYDLYEEELEEPSEASFEEDVLIEEEY